MRGLRALLGDEAAGDGICPIDIGCRVECEERGCGPGCWERAETQPVNAWVLDLVRLVEEAAERECGGWTGRRTAHKYCGLCKGTGKVRDLLLLRLALAVVRAALERECQGCASGFPGQHDLCGGAGPSLEAAEVYLADPTEQHREEWAQAFRVSGYFSLEILDERGGYLALLVMRALESIGLSGIKVACLEALEEVT